ncbi:hypothetical protein PsYK624_111390 [Phanerochaete sordida]|uniref:Uncharacterized protein n=1 Tax=Phanerochaete sordida TaxID=48140 RepID=A0A9P3LIA2_9APHY|nr:hypothetical protein PsYK624_111390 [Phanerochaete sordida]
MPPTTPPAIAPPSDTCDTAAVGIGVTDDDDGVAELVVELVRADVKELNAVGELEELVDDAELEVDEDGGPIFEELVSKNCSAANALKLFVACTLMNAQAGTVVSSGIARE